ncbi:Antiviral helicase SKI2, partial [Bienertia sinuspersici]
MWHGGMFQKMGSGLKYIGGEIKTFDADTDELCWFLLQELATKCGGYSMHDQIYYMEPDAECFEKGLRRVYTDAEVRKMTEIVLKYRTLNLYVVPAANADMMRLFLGEGSSDFNALTQRRKKLSPRRKESQKKEMERGDHCIIPCGGFNKQKKASSCPIVEPSLGVAENPNVKNTPFQASKNSELVPHTKNQTFPQVLGVEYCNFPNVENTSQPVTSQITQLDPFETYLDIQAWEAENDDTHELSDATSSEDDAYEPNSSDHITDVEVDHAVETEFEDHAVETESKDDIGKEEQLYSDGDTDDDEFRDSRTKIQAWNAKALNIAKQLQKKVVEGTVISEQKEVVDDEQEAERGQDGYVSEYEASGDELDTDLEIEEDELGRKKRKQRAVVVNCNTDFTKFQWTVGIRFPNREEFKECVTRYAVAQGRNLTWIVSDKNRQQRLGVKCNPGCPFRLYCSWDSRRAALVVKSVEDQHTCVRNMESNRQLKSTWLAKQFLEIFKIRPHWPAKDIVETVRVAYRVLVKMEKVHPGAAISFKAHNPALFCRAFVRTESKCDVIMSNMAETFNGYIIHARSKHLIYMLEDIRAALMQRMVLKKTEMEKHQFNICPRVQAKLEKEKEEAAHWPGRPRKNRRKKPMEDPKKKGKLTKHGVEMRCSVCKSNSHNKRKCPDKDKAIVEQPAKRRRGRPRKVAAVEDPGVQQIIEPTHHSATAEPSRTGRGGRMIRGGRGSRGGSTGGGSRGGSRGGSSRGGGRNAGSRGRNGRGDTRPKGIGVLFTEDGSPYTNVDRTENTEEPVTAIRSTIEVKKFMAMFFAK